MADSDLSRTHPATIATGSAKALWQMIVGLVVVFVFGGLGGQGLPAFAIGGIIALVVVGGVALSWLNWWRFSYGIVGSDLLVVEGLLVRKRRTIPIARVHGVNVRADLFMRMLGLVEIVVQTAGGGSNEPEATIGAISLARAEELRNALLYDNAPATESAPEVIAADAPAPGTTAEQLIGADPVGRISDFRGAFGGSENRGREVRFEHKVPLGRLIIGEITSNRVPIIIAIIAGVGGQMINVVGTDLIEEAAAEAASLAIPVLIGLLVLVGIFTILIAASVAIARDFGFTARRFENRIETEAGLFERRQISLPVTRIQSVRIEESWLRRLLGFATVHVDTAGLERSSQQGQQATGSKAMIPVARRADVPALMHGLLPEAETFPTTNGLPPRALRFYLLLPTLSALLLTALLVGPTSWFIYRPAFAYSIGVVIMVGTITAGVRALQWHAAGIGSDENSITIRTGIIGYKRVLLTRSRIQSLTVKQNPFQRRADLASLEAVSVSGSAQAAHSISHLSDVQATRIMQWYQRGLARPQTQPAE